MKHISDIDLTNALAASAPEPEPAQTRQRFTLGQLNINRHASVAAAVRKARYWQIEKLSGRNYGISLVLCGSNGIGKTHIARALWWTYICQAVDLDGNPLPGTELPTGRWFDADRLMALLGQTRDPETNMVTTAQAANVIGPKIAPTQHNGVPLIVIDDVGSESTIPFVGKDDQAAERQARYFKAIDYCYQSDEGAGIRPISVIITSNLPVNELEAHLGRRCWDRLLQMAPKKPESMIFDMGNVPSYRKQAGGR